jgi:uroporphyrinogen decarboxylase
MPTSRERVVTSLNYQAPDRVPKDLGGMLSTGVSMFAYPKLVKTLGLPARRPRAYDSGQMLALPDLDVLDALGCDVVTIVSGVTNAFPQPELWHEYDFNGRLPALVLNPEAYEAQPDGTITQYGSRMVPGSYVFDAEHGGQPIMLSGELPREDLKKLKQDLAANPLSDEYIKSRRELCRRVRESSDRAVFLNDMALVPDISIHSHGGMAVFPIICLEDPDYVMELHEIICEATLRNMRALLPEVKDYVDIVWTAGDDWGTQKNLIASPKVYRDLFLPYRRRINDECHALAPAAKTFLHSCGAIYDLIDLLVESGFDIMNPVQWSAGTRSYAEWKDKACGRITLWGGGVNSQVTLAHGTPEQVAAEAREVVQVMQQDGGFVFCAIHNILAEVAPEKIVALYRAI